MKKNKSYKTLIIVSLFSFTIVFILNHLVLRNAAVIESNPATNMYKLGLTNTEQIKLFIISMIPNLIQLIIVILFIYTYVIKKEVIDHVFYSSLVMIVCSVGYAVVNYININNPISDLVFVTFMVLSWGSKAITVLVINKKEKEINYA